MMSGRRLFFCLLFVIIFAALIWIPTNSQVPGRNVNMVAGDELPDGDPWLQRQNEPSIAVSTRNFLHLLAGANDYRTVDMAMPEEELPGLPEGVAAGDAWLGVFKSFNGGQSWISTLLPGYPQDISPEGANSPLKGFDAAADPTVRAGANGLFYYSGIAFNREKNGRGVVFVARYIDNNNKENGDTIQYIDTTVIDEGTSGQFADKPWIAVDIPRGAGTVPIQVPDTPTQYIPRSNVYMVYSLFLGDIEQNVHNKILFARSTDCGETWGHPVKLSESERINQGTTIAIDPRDGTIYVAWRRFQSGTESDAILVAKSTDFGQKFSKAEEAASIDPFDQGTSTTSFRTNAYPTMAVDGGGTIYLAWSQRGKGPQGDARIVIATSTNGKHWSDPVAVDNHNGRGHQIMPSLTFAAGKLMLTWYDLRKDESGIFEYYIDDDAHDIRHTMDVRVADAAPGTNPDFGNSVQVSRYLWAIKDDGLSCYQVQFNPPNYPLFKQGTVPFMGDYIDIGPSPMFLKDSNGDWRYNQEDTDPSIFHVTWTDNRDVRPPHLPPYDWTNYNPPNSTQPLRFPQTACSDPDSTGMRNQNVYTSRIAPGIEVGSLGNNKPLGVIQRAFVVLVKNTTEVTRSFWLTIEAPDSVEASFVQSNEHPAYPLDQVDVDIAPHSSISRPVFVKSTNPNASITVNVTEIGGAGYNGSVVLNSDETNPDIVNPEGWDPNDPGILEAEIHNPRVDNPRVDNLSPLNPNVTNYSFTNPRVDNKSVINPDLVNPRVDNPDLTNPNLTNPRVDNPRVDNTNILNPNVENTAITEDDIEEGSIEDIQWTVKNEGNTASSYTFRNVSPESLPEGIYAQLLIYRIHYTPSSDGSGQNACNLKKEPHHELLVNIINPEIIDPNVDNPRVDNPRVDNPRVDNATFALAPGEEALVVLRMINPDPTAMTVETLQAAQDFANSAGAAATAHSANTGDTKPQVGMTNLRIITTSLPNGIISMPYEGRLVIFGGTLPHQWLIVGDLPPDLELVNPGEDILIREISGPPQHVEGLDYPATYTFTLQVSDANGISASQELSIVIAEELIIETTSLPEGTVGEPYSATLEASGGIVPYIWSLASDSDPLPEWLSLDSESGVLSGTPPFPDTWNFKIEVTDSGNYSGGGPQTATQELSITVVAASPTIMGEVTSGDFPLEGVLIEGLPEDPTTDEDGQYMAVVDYDWSGTATPAKDGWIFSPSFREYNNVSSNQTNQDYAALKKEDWVARYNNESVNGDDEASALDVDSSGNIYVSGYSTGKTTGADYATVKYDSSGSEAWVVKYDGPSHEGDYVEDIIADSSGNTYVTGYSYRGMPWKHSDYYTVRYDSSGNEEWDVRYDGQRNGNDEALAIAIDSSYVYVTGRSQQSKGDEKNYDYYTAKYDIGNGKKRWDFRYDGLGESDDEAAAVAVDSAGNVNVTGRSTGDGTGFDYYTAKYDSSGDFVWEARYDNGSVNGNDEATGVAVDSSGNVYVTGRSTGDDSSFDYYTIKYAAADGAVLWEKRYNNDDQNGDDEAMAIVVDSSGNVYVTGRSEGSGTDYDYYTAKYAAADGEVLWEKRYNNDDKDGHDEATAMAIDDSGDIYVTGRSKGSGTGFDYYTIKYFSDDGRKFWVARYNNEDENGEDQARAIVVDSSGNVYVTGSSQGSGTSKDYATVKYKQ